jgi:hypothetical protein
VEKSPYFEKCLKPNFTEGETLEVRLEEDHVLGFDRFVAWIYGGTVGLIEPGAGSKCVDLQLRSGCWEIDDACLNSRTGPWTYSKIIARRPPLLPLTCTTSASLIWETPSSVPISSTNLSVTSPTSGKFNSTRPIRGTEIVSQH